MSSAKRGGGTNGSVSIPSASKKVVQSLKEIVNYPEAEIYAMLKECNMDPNEAVSRLLSQDPFHEVKSKREKKKENKDVHDSRPRGTISMATRSGRGGLDRYSSRGGPSQFGGPDSGASRGKLAYKKDDGPTANTNYTTGIGNNVNNMHPPYSDAIMDKLVPSNTAENFPAALPSSGFQTAGGGTAGQVSMADIVKMGRPHGKSSSSFSVSQQHINNQHAMFSAGRTQANDLHASQNYAYNVSKTNLESVITGSHVSPNDDDWPLDEEPAAASISTVLEPSVESELDAPPYDSTKQQFISQTDEVTYVEDETGDKTLDNFVQSLPSSNQNIQGETDASGFDNDLYENINSYQVHHQEVEEASVSVSSATVNLQSLSLERDDEDSLSEEDGPAVKIPDHLQVQSADFSHLSFGSFRSGMGAPFSGSFASRSIKSNEEEAPMATEPLPAGQCEARNPEYYEDEHLKPASDEIPGHRIVTDSGSFETPSVSQPDDLKHEVPEATEENGYSFPSSTANYSFENSQQLNESFAQQQSSSQMQGLPSLSGVMPYSNSLASSLLSSNGQPLREAELAYSPFPISQSLPTKYSNPVSSISVSTASIAEAMKASNFSAGQPTQTLPSGNISGGPALPQQLVHPYSQPSVPMGHYASMLSYPFLPQSYPYLPSAFQQAFAAGNSNFPQSLEAAMLPQYKNSVSISSLPQSAAVPSGYAAFGNSNSIPSNFPLNHLTAPSAGTSMSYEDLLSSQYKDASHLLSLQQGPGSRTMSGIPGSAYYSFQGQSQQQQQLQPQPPAGFRQSQQPAHQQQQQHYGPLSGYPNFYHSQVGPTLEQQLQMARDGGSQGQQQKQTQQQLWQNNY